MELIRDNLIQNGISFPTKSFEKYEDCFFVSERLSSLSWFLFVNNVSGSSIGEGYALFPQQTYKQKIRSLVYAEYVDVGKDFAGMMLPRRRTDDVDSNFNFLSKSQARVSPFGEQYSKVESAGNEFLDLVKKSQETIEGDDFDNWDDFDVETIEQPESEEVGVSVESQTDIDIANLVEDEDGFLVDGDSLKANEGDSSGFEDGSNESDDWVSEDSEDDFDDWGSGNSEGEDEFESWDDSDDVFESWNNSDEDELESWGTNDSEVEDDADFDDWGSSDEVEEDSDGWESPSEEDEDDFDDWGGSDETDDADFDDWGSSNDSEDLNTNFEDDADFDDWGSDGEDEPEEELEDDADFDDWGSSDEVEEEDFDDWGSSEEVEPKVTKGTPFKQVKRSPASELKAETEMMDFFERGVNSLFRSTVSNGKKFGRRFASLPENEEK